MAQQRYKILKKIDAGGMAEIFLARAQSVGGIEKIVAIKRVLPSLTTNKRFVSMFLDEARLAMVLTHANIVQVFDVGHADDTYFIVMEYVEGVNLRRVFQRLSERGQRLPAHYAVYLMMEVCKGLAHAHDQRDGDGRPLGIVHRDISPPNILISKSGEVKITDFGLAKAATQLEQTDAGIVKGKFSYLSPEAANGVTVDHRADLFAVGILLWELLANRRLFVGKTDLDTIDLVRDAEIPALSLFNRDVTPQLEQIVSRALAQDVRARWHSARDLGDELARYLFSNNLKVTAYDLAAQIQGLMAEEGEVVDSAERLVLLVEEEIQNLSMLGLLGDGIRMDGAQPLNEADFQSAPTSRLAVADVWRTRSDPDLSSRIDLADLLEKLDAQGADSSRLRAASDSSRRNWVVALAVGVLLLGGAALAWFAF